MSGLRTAVGELYRQVHAPEWAAPNLDALADVLRDLSWLPPGPVTVHVPAGVGDDLPRLLSVLVEIETETARSAHPVLVLVG